MFLGQVATLTQERFNMHIKKISLIVTSLFITAVSANDQPPVQANDFIEVFQTLFGEHKGERKNHIVGLCASGDFTASQAASNYSTSLLFAGETVPAIMRFSLPGGNPNTPDSANIPRGFAAQFSLPDGSKHNIANLNVPVFAAKDPQTFLGLLKTSLPAVDGKVDVAKVQAFKQAHPDTKPLDEWLASHLPPYSYASASYYGIHTFYLQNKAAEQTKIRWKLSPRHGEKNLSEAEQKAAPPRFLAERLATQLQQGPVLFDWTASIGKASDSDIDSTAMWPNDRQQINLGVLRITAVGGEACTPLNFDPNLVSSGVTTSDDPVLKIRSPAYAISFGKRLSGQ